MGAASVMSPSFLSLLGFTVWTLLLVLAVVSYRSMMVLSGRRPANDWHRARPSQQDPEFLQRLTHAHANCLENLPLFASVIIVAGLTGKLALTDPLAPWYLALRLAQTAVHLTGTSARLVTVRFSFFLPQLLILGWMVIRLVGSGM